jgi:hypothetical protein
MISRLSAGRKRLRATLFLVCATLATNHDIYEVATGVKVSARFCIANGYIDKGLDNYHVHPLEPAKHRAFPSMQRYLSLISA